MQKFEYIFESLPFNKENAARVEEVIRQAMLTDFVVGQHSSGWVHAIVYLPSFEQFLNLEMVFITAGLRL